jgi:hypothetical protein
MAAGESLGMTPLWLTSVAQARLHTAPRAYGTAQRAWRLSLVC